MKTFIALMMAGCLSGCGTTYVYHQHHAQPRPVAAAPAYVVEKHVYHYYPDLELYWCPSLGRYAYIQGGLWVVTVAKPAVLTPVHRHVVIETEVRDPWRQHEVYRVKYPRCQPPIVVKRYDNDARGPEHDGRPDNMRDNRPDHDKGDKYNIHENNHDKYVIINPPDRDHDRGNDRQNGNNDRDRDKGDQDHRRDNQPGNGPDRDNGRDQGDKVNIHVNNHDKVVIINPPDNDKDKGRGNENKPSDNRNEGRDKGDKYNIHENNHNKYVVVDPPDNGKDKGQGNENKPPADRVKDNKKQDSQKYTTPAKDRQNDQPGRQNTRLGNDNSKKQTVVTRTQNDRGDKKDKERKYSSRD